MINKYDRIYKEYLALERRDAEISKKLAEIPLTKLKEPYQRGWVVFYDLRQDIKNRKDSNIISEALTLGFSKGYTRSVKIVKSIRKDKSFRGHQKDTYGIYPNFIDLSEKKYQNLGEDAKKYFFLNEYCDLYKKHKIKLYNMSLPSYWLILKVKLYIITHTQKKGGDLEREQAHIYKKMREYWTTQTGGYSKSYPKDKDRTKPRDSIVKFKKGEIEDIFNEKMPLIYYY